MVWYGEHSAKHVIDNIYFVWKGELSNSVYVVADRENYTESGIHIEGKEVAYWYVMSKHAIKKQIRDEIYDYLCVEG